MATGAKNWGPCGECTHYRVETWVFQRLGLLRVLRDAESRKAIKEYQDQEMKNFEHECIQKINGHGPEESIWPGKPEISAHCAVDEQQQVYYIAEIKNAGCRCRQYQQRAPANRSCETCHHRRTAEGASVDAERIRELTTMYALGYDNVHYELQQYQQSIGPKKAAEIHELMINKTSLSEPNYLEHCAALSRHGAFVMCVNANRYNVCEQWSQEIESSVKTLHAC